MFILKTWVSSYILAVQKKAELPFCESELENSWVMAAFSFPGWQQGSSEVRSEKCHPAPRIFNVFNARLEQPHTQSNRTRLFLPSKY